MPIGRKQMPIGRKQMPMLSGESSPTLRIAKRHGDNMNIHFHNRMIIVSRLRGSLLWACTWHGGQRKHIIVNNLPMVDELYNLSGVN